eukprot:scaffold16820_cov54-Phaeocystis_antarctica.AAC.1
MSTRQPGAVGGEGEGGGDSGGDGGGGSDGGGGYNGGDGGTCGTAAGGYARLSAASPIALPIRKISGLHEQGGVDKRCTQRGTALRLAELVAPAAAAAAAPIHPAGCDDV